MSPCAGIRPAATSSSAITGTPGAASASAARMIASAARSHTVTGDWSLLVSTSNPAATSFNISAPASRAATDAGFEQTRFVDRHGKDASFMPQRGAMRIPPSRRMLSALR